MNNNFIKKNIFIVSISSDIGANLAKFWLSEGHSVAGTYRKKSSLTNSLESMGVDLYRLDLKSTNSCIQFMKEISHDYLWDALIIGAGDLNPVGQFIKTNFKLWEESIRINFTGQFEVLQKMIPLANTYNNNSPVCLFFAGGGTNGAVKNYSAYTISKIASIKMVELLDAEIPNITFTILGPGRVETKIHKPTLESSFEEIGEEFYKTKTMLENNTCFPLEDVIQCCDWLIYQDRKLIGGRNFSAEYDPWNDSKIFKIIDNFDIFKLRRHGNDFFK